jgi:soluble lytic murein transglycosylase
MAVSFKVYSFNDQKDRFLRKDILKKLPPRLRGSAKHFMPTVIFLANKYKVDPYWVTAVIWTESHFKTTAESSVGARGLMQIMPRTKDFLLEKLYYSKKLAEFEKPDAEILKMAGNDWYGRLYKYKENLENLELGIYYFSSLLKKFKSYHLASVAYNMGPTWVRRNLYLKKEVGSSNNDYLNKIIRRYQILMNSKTNLKLASVAQ